jgi:hypothetical protein
MLVIGHHGSGRFPQPVELEVTRAHEPRKLKMTLPAFPRTLIHVVALIAGLVVTASAEEAPARFVSPVDGQVVRPGETIPVVLEIDPQLQATWATVMGRMDVSGLLESPEGFKAVTGPPFETTFVIDRNVSGPTLLTAGFFAESSGFIGSVSISLNVVPANLPISIVTMQDALHFRLSSSPSDPKRIAVVGKYIDDVSLSLNDPVLGTTFESSDTAVAIVDERGNVRGVAPGIAVITVRNGAASAWVAVAVDDDANRGVPPIDQTAKVAVSGSGFRFDPVSRRFTQQVTVVNRSQEPLVHPLVLVLDDLTPGVGVRSQLTKTLPPVGAPWVWLGDERGVFAPGASVTIEVEFTNPQGLLIEYTPIVYSARHPI